MGRWTESEMFDMWCNLVDEAYTLEFENVWMNTEILMKRPIAGYANKWTGLSKKGNLRMMFPGFMKNMERKFPDP